MDIQVQSPEGALAAQAKVHRRLPCRGRPSKPYCIDEGKVQRNVWAKEKYFGQEGNAWGAFAEQIKEIADQNPSYAAYYKKKLVASEERVRDLTKMKSFMMSDHKKKTALTSTRKIAERYQLELDSVKQQLQSSEQTRNRVEQRILNMELQQRRRRRPQSAGVRRNSKINPIINRLQSENSELSASSSIAPADAMLSELREELKEQQMLKGGNAQSMPIISTTSIISETSQYEVPITFASNSLKSK